MILGSEGRYVPSSLFLHVMKDYDFAIRQFQVVQSQPGELTLRIVKGLRYSDAVREEIIGVLRRYVGTGMQFSVECVETIPLTRTGKRLTCINRLPVQLSSQAVVTVDSA